MKEGDDAALPMHGDVDPARIHGPISNDTITDTGNWEDSFAAGDAQRRAACKDWDAAIPA